MQASQAKALFQCPGAASRTAAMEASINPAVASTSNGADASFTPLPARDSSVKHGVILNGRESARAYENFRVKSICFIFTPLQIASHISKPILNELALNQK